VGDHDRWILILGPRDDSNPDAVGSVAFHPLESCLLSASGSRHFIVEQEQELEDEDEDLSDTDAASSFDRGGASNSHPRWKESDARRERRCHPVTLDSTLKLWNFGDALDKYLF
jgi:hypothetical protein